MARQPRGIVVPHRARRQRFKGLTLDERRRARERYLNQLGYRAQVLAFRKAHLGAHWVAHFQAKADRLFMAALDVWRRDNDA